MVITNGKISISIVIEGQTGTRFFFLKKKEFYLMDYLEKML